MLDIGLETTKIGLQGSAAMLSKGIAFGLDKTATALSGMASSSGTSTFDSLLNNLALGFKQQAAGFDTMHDQFLIDANEDAGDVAKLIENAAYEVEEIAVGATLMATDIVLIGNSLANIVLPEPMEVVTSKEMTKIKKELDRIRNLPGMTEHDRSLLTRLTVGLGTGKIAGTVGKKALAQTTGETLKGIAGENQNQQQRSSVIGAAAEDAASRRKPKGQSLGTMDEPGTPITDMGMDVGVQPSQRTV